MSDQIESRLTRVFQNVFEDQNLQIFNETNASDIEEWDSLMQIHLLIAIESEFSVRLNPLLISELENVGQMIEMLRTLTH